VTVEWVISVFYELQSPDLAIREVARKRVANYMSDIEARLAALERLEAERVTNKKGAK
jgi:hypothetical protein